MILPLPWNHEAMEHLYEGEINTVVNPEDGDRWKVRSVHTVDGEEQDDKAEEGPARDVPGVLLQSNQVSPVPSWGGGN